MASIYDNWGSFFIRTSIPEYQYLKYFKKNNCVFVPWSFISKVTQGIVKKINPKEPEAGFELPVVIWKEIEPQDTTLRHGFAADMTWVNILSILEWFKTYPEYHQPDSSSYSRKFETLYHLLKFMHLYENGCNFSVDIESVEVVALLNNVTLTFEIDKSGKRILTHICKKNYEQPVTLCPAHTELIDNLVELKQTCDQLRSIDSNPQSVNSDDINPLTECLFTKLKQTYDRMKSFDPSKEYVLPESNINASKENISPESDIDERPLVFHDEDSLTSLDSKQQSKPWWNDESTPSEHDTDEFFYQSSN